MKRDLIKKKYPGMEAVAKALQLEDFPMDKSNIDYSVGHLEVFDESGKRVPVRNLTDRIEQTDFDSVDEVISALSNALSHMQISDQKESA